jgi:hypothetical protein
LDRIEERRNKPETFIKDLVSSFLIPDVQRKKLQRQCKLIFALICVFSAIRGEEIPRDSKEDHPEFCGDSWPEDRERASIVRLNGFKETEVNATTECALLSTDD